MGMTQASEGELLLGLRFLRNKARSTNFSSRVSYCLIYGASETYRHGDRGCRSVKYCLIYGISETLGKGEQLIHGVNYYLDYRTFETSSLALAARRR